MKLVFFSGSDFCLPILEAVHQSQNITLREIINQEISKLKLAPDFLQQVNLVLALPELQLYLNQSVRVAAVVTSPKVELRGREIPNQIASWCLQNQLPVLQPAKLNSEFLAELSSLKPEIGLVASYGKILKSEVLHSFPLGMLNWHPSLLPKYRGPSPMQSTLLNGDLVTGLTWITMDEGMDSGPILAQFPEELSPGETIFSLKQKMISLGINSWGLAILAQLASYKSGSVQLAKKQIGEASFTKKFQKEDGQIEPSALNSKQVYNHFRALLEFPKTSFSSIYFGQLVKILNCQFSHASPDNSDSQTVFEDQQILQVKQAKTLITYLKCQNSFLELTQIQLADGKKIELSGYQFKPSSQL